MSRRQRRQQRLDELQESKKLLKIQKNEIVLKDKVRRAKCRNIGINKLMRAAYKQEITKKLEKKFKKKLNKELARRFAEHRNKQLRYLANEGVALRNTNRLNKKIKTEIHRINDCSGLTSYKQDVIDIEVDRIIKRHGVKYSDNHDTKVWKEEERIIKKRKARKLEKKKQIVSKQTLYFCHISYDIFPVEIMEIIIIDIQKKYWQYKHIVSNKKWETPNILIWENKPWCWEKINVNIG